MQQSIQLARTPGLSGRRVVATEALPKRIATLECSSGPYLPMTSGDLQLILLMGRFTTLPMPARTITTTRSTLSARMELLLTLSRHARATPTSTQRTGCCIAAETRVQAAVDSYSLK